MSHKFPAPVKRNGRLYFWRSTLEAHKRVLAGLPPAPEKPDAVAVLVRASEVSAEFGFGRRTLGRRVREAEAPPSAQKDDPIAQIRAIFRGRLTGPELRRLDAIAERIGKPSDAAAE